MKFLLATIFTLSLTIRRSVSQDVGDNPPCEICGCSFCTDGEFPMENLGGELDFASFAESYSGLTANAAEEAAITELATDFPMASIPCVVLNMASDGGVFPEEVCSDYLRLNPVLRTSCGCPALPDHPADLNPFSFVVAPTPEAETPQANDEILIPSIDNKKRSRLVPALAVGLALVALLVAALAFFCNKAREQPKDDPSVETTMTPTTGSIA